MFVRVNLFITDAREISIEMIPVTDSPRISQMADTQNVYVYRTGGEKQKGTPVLGREARGRLCGTGRRGGDNKRGKIRWEERKKKAGKENWRKTLKRDKICKKTRKRARLWRTSSTVGIVESCVTLDKDFG